jgi:hypothetical protein
MENKLELRMYGFVNYQLTGIQMGIQFAHSIVEYGLENFNTDKYLDWANNHKTVILLNGGTTNNNPDRFGTINQTFNILKENGIVCSSFSEPDLGDQMTAISFIIDERVFNRKNYPDFGDWVMENHFSYLKNNMLTGSKIERMRKEGYFLNASDKEQKLYSDWVNLVGGEKNVFLRDFLNPNKVKLA